VNSGKTFHDVTPSNAASAGSSSANQLGDIRDLPLPPSNQIRPTALPVQPTVTASANQSAPSNIIDSPLTKSPIETPHPVAKRSFPWLRDITGLAIFVGVVIVGAWLINTLVFRSFNVDGPSMEPTLSGGVNGQVSDRLIVNRLPLTIAGLTGQTYVPKRGQIIVFKDPRLQSSGSEEYIVKRVVGLPNERVTVNDCQLRVYNDGQPKGFDPYPDFKNFADNDQTINTCIDGDGTDVRVPDDAIFVVGDHRVGDYSADSRNGGGRPSLGTVPLRNVVGPVALRIWPLNQLKLF
jgi:signal peptidase I